MERGGLSDAAIRVLLPESLCELAQLISIDAVLKLVEQFGGVRLYVPKVVRQSGKLAKLLGMPAAEALSARCGGGRIEVPLAPNLGRAIRDEEIRSLDASGYTVAEVARRLRIHQRTVYQVLSNARNEARLRGG